MDLNQMPHTDSEVIRILWKLQVAPKLDQLVLARDDVNSYKPPTKAEVEDYIQKSKKTNPDLTGLINRRNELTAALALVDAKINDYAHSHLVRYGSVDEKKAAQQKYNVIKNEVTYAIKAMKSQAEQENDKVVMSFCDTLWSQLMPSKTKVSSTTEARKWLKENRPDIPLSDKGKLPAHALAVYDNRDKDGGKE